MLLPSSLLIMIITKAVLIHTIYPGVIFVFYENEDFVLQLATTTLEYIVGGLEKCISSAYQFTNK